MAKKPVVDAVMSDGESEQRVLVRRLRILHRIASATTATDANRVDSALGFALEELGLDQAYLGAIDEATNELVMETVVARGGEPTYGAGKRYPLASTLIGHVIDCDSVLVAPDVAKSRAEYGVVYQDEWKSYIAVAISFGGRRYGAIGFKGRRLRDQPFSEIDIEFVQITGDLIAASVDRKLQRERLDALAFYDALTGAANRVLFADRLAQCIIAAKRSDARFALFYLDLDGFKAVNDDFGHAAGDEVLKQFAKRLTGTARESDTIARLGGDEFVVLAPSIEIGRDALELAQRFAQNGSRSILVDGQSFALSVSIGISLFPDHGTDAPALVCAADAAMFDAKSRGKNCIRFAPDRATVAVD